MIEVKFSKKESLKVEVEGHSLFDIKGKDIVCSAVSVLLQSWHLGMQEIAKCKVLLERRSGFFLAIVETRASRELLCHL